MDLKNTIQQIINLSKMGKVVKNSWTNHVYGYIFGSLKLGPVIISGCGSDINVCVINPKNAIINDYNTYKQFLADGGELINVTGKIGSWDEVIAKQIVAVEKEIQDLYEICNQEVASVEAEKEIVISVKIAIAKTICDSVVAERQIDP